MRGFSPLGRNAGNNGEVGASDLGGGRRPKGVALVPSLLANLAAARPLRALTERAADVVQPALVFAIGLGIGVAIGAGSVEGPAVWWPGFFDRDFWKNSVAGAFVLLLIDVPLTVVVVQKVVERLRYRTWLRSSRVSRGALSHRLALAEGRLNFLEWTVTEFRKRSGPQAGGPWGPLPADGDEIDRFNNAARELGEDAGVAYEVAGFDAPADARDLLASFRHKASRLSGFTAEYDPRRMGSPWRWLTQVEFQLTAAQEDLARLQARLEHWDHAVPAVPAQQFGPFDPSSVIRPSAPRGARS